MKGNRRQSYPLLADCLTVTEAVAAETVVALVLVVTLLLEELVEREPLVTAIWAAEPLVTATWAAVGLEMGLSMGGRFIPTFATSALGVPLVA
jgi:hypothetical protein